MTWFARLVKFFKRLNPLEIPLALLDERRAQAEWELERQREGVQREQRQRDQVQAEIDRLILKATRDVLRHRPMGRQG